MTVQVITSSMETYRHVLPLIAAAADSDEFRGRLLGIHMEGPFISPLPGYHGAHPVKHVQVPTHELVEELVVSYTWLPLETSFDLTVVGRHLLAESCGW